MPLCLTSSPRSVSTNALTFSFFSLRRRMCSAKTCTSEDYAQSIGRTDIGESSLAHDGISGVEFGLVVGWDL